MQDPVSSGNGLPGVQGSGMGPVQLHWGPVFAGAIVATAVSFVLLAFGSGIGMSVSSSAPTWRNASPGLGMLSGLWVMLIALASFALGGYMAGRFRTRNTPGARADEVEFRDGMHGLMVWALAVIISAIVALTIARNVAPLAAEREAGNAGAASGSVSGVPRNLAYEVDRLLRTERRADAPNREGVRGEVGRLLAAAVEGRNFSPDDRAYLSRVVASETGSAAPDADRRVDVVLRAARDQANRARRAGVVLAFMTAASLLLGALAAWMAAGLGGRHRDEDRSPALPTPDMPWRSPATRGGS